MAVDSVAAATAASKATGAGQKIAETFDDFIELLITQLKNQDPTQPMDTSQFTQQLVQFSQVQQSVDTNINLEKLIAATQGSQINNAVGYIGKSVDAVGNKGNLLSGIAQFTYELPAKASAATITLQNAAGQVVYSGDGPTNAGKNFVLWDGTNSLNGQQMPDGTYTISIVAKDAAGKSMAAKTYTTGVVTSVDLKDGEVMLMLNDLGVPMDKVVSIREPYLLTPDGTESGDSANDTNNQV